MKAVRGIRCAAGRVVLVQAIVLAAAMASAQDRPAVPAAGGPQEGIKVHGHWVIEVRNPDGTLAERREFDNSLAPGGPQLLVQWLSRSASPARWTIELGDYSLPGPCNGGTIGIGTVNTCWIVDSAATPAPTGTAVFKTLTMTTPQADRIVLTGNATALVQGRIEYVATRQSSCAGTTAPQSCNNAGTTLQFTVHDLRDAQGGAAPLSLAAGQIVQVTVTLTFS